MKFDHNVTVTKLKRIWNKYTNNERMGGGGGSSFRIYETS